MLSAQLINILSYILVKYKYGYEETVYVVGVDDESVISLPRKTRAIWSGAKI